MGEEDWIRHEKCSRENNEEQRDILEKIYSRRNGYIRFEANFEG